VIAAVHVTPWLTVPAALAIGAGLAWYWRQLGREGIGGVQRFVRRLSIGLMLLALVALVRGLSFVDPVVQGPQYVVAWSVALLLVILVFFVACADGAVTMRLLREARDHELRRAGREDGGGG